MARGDFFPAIFAFLEIVGNARTFLRTYDFGTGTKNEKKFLRFVISILITAKNGKEIVLIRQCILTAGRDIFLACASYTMVAPMAHLEMKTCPNT